MAKEVVYFRRVTESDIQLVRFWRNSEHVRLNMLYQDLIHPDQQVSWFKTAQINGEHHFIFSHGVHDVGMVSIKASDTPSIYEAGIFCGRADYLGSSINVAAAMGLYDYGFRLPGNNRFRARVLRTNTAALRMNESLGYERVVEHDEEVVELELTQANYEASKAKLSRFVPWVPSFL